MDYAGKHALVLGLGESGLAMAQWLARCGTSVRVADTRENPDRLEALRSSVPDVEFIGGVLVSGLLDGMDFIAVSPGLMPRRELADMLPAAAERGIPVWSEIELFAQALAALKQERGYAPKVIAITGTNGKTTVTSMVGHMCRRAGLSVEVAGNISPAALDVLRRVVEEDSLPQAWTLELSSFQLYTTYSLNPDAATVLNVTQDHLDWHDGMEDYAAAKARIFGANTVRVLNRDDQWVMNMRSQAAACVTFGLDEPDETASFGLRNERGLEWLCVAESPETEEKPRRKSKGAAAEPQEISLRMLMPAEALRVQGRHNASNALAALALCRAVGLPFAPLLQALRDYRGEPHRVEPVATIGGVTWFDDSKGTNVGATVAALQGLGASENRKRIVLIAGGDGKDQDFSPLVEPVRQYVKTVLLIGKDAGRIEDALHSAQTETVHCKTLEATVQRAAEVAKEGDIVLLSPACASMDMFRNYAHRAQVFIDSVREVGLARGEVMP